jgi:hypothetical protein
MGYGWAFVGEMLTGSGGPESSVQYKKFSGATAGLTGSSDLRFLETPSPSELHLTGAFYHQGDVFHNGFVFTLGSGNSNCITSNTTVPGGTTSTMNGPIAVAAGATLTVGAQSHVVISRIHGAIPVTNPCP